MTSPTPPVPSRPGHPGPRRLGTFSYLPPLGREQLRRQVEYILAQGWTCAIEHVEPIRSTSTYWYLWKLPMFGELNAQAVIDELDACHRANPGHHVRLIGYDRRRQTRGLTLVTHHGGSG